jgi:hypothetical protein
MATKDKRFQLFLFGLHDKTAEQADKNGVSLSTEVRNRVSRSYWQDEIINFLLTNELENYSIDWVADFVREKKIKHEAEMKTREEQYVNWKAKQ